MNLLAPFTLPQDNEVKIVVGDALAMLRMVPSNSIHCVVTSPPYWGLRNYGVPGQLGLEATPDEYVTNMVRVFREVRRVLREDGNCFLNIGDSYLKEKDKALIPFRLALALQADGWWVRQDNIWHKPNCMPESVKDRTTTAHEYVFHLTKAARYWYDADAIAEPITESTMLRLMQDIASQKGSDRANGGEKTNGAMKAVGNLKTRNCRSVWRFPTGGFAGAHFAVFPPELPERCILAGCPEGGIVLDPFGGAGTTGLVALRLNRRALLIELSSDYAELARKRIYNDAPLFNLVGVA